MCVRMHARALSQTFESYPPQFPKSQSRNLNSVQTHSLFFFSRGLGWRMHLGVEVTELSTNKQHHLYRFSLY